jgi:hypothetical protein
MDRRVDWIARKGALAAALYLAIVAGVDWLFYAIAAAVWWPLLTNLWSVPVGTSWRSAGPAPLPPTAAMTFDLGVLGSMFLAHWYWTAFAYAAACGLALLVQARATSKP